MGTKVTAATISGAYASVSELNANFALLADEFDKCLYRDGTVPNGMTANLDMNSNYIINLADGGNDNDAVTVRQLNAAIINSGATLLIDTPYTQYGVVYAETTGMLITSPTLFHNDTSSDLTVMNLNTKAASIDIEATGSAADLDINLIAKGTGGVNVSTFLAVTGIATVSGHTTIGGGATASELRLLEPSGGGSSYFAFKAPALAASLTFTLPDADGSASDVLTTNGAGVLSWTTPSGGGGGLTLGTLVASTSGSSIDFTGIPAGTKQVIITFKSVSLSGTDYIQFQLGDSGGIETTGYVSAGTFTGGSSGGTNSTSAFVLYSTTATNKVSGAITFTLMDAATFLWAGSGVFCLDGGNYTFQCGGAKALSAELTQVRIKSSGSNTFDNGSINIAYQ